MTVRSTRSSSSCSPTSPRSAPVPPPPHERFAARRRRRPSVRGSALTGAPDVAAVRRTAGQPPPRPRGALAARPRPRLLHDRFGGARGQCGGGRGAAAHRSGAAALPIGWLLPRPGSTGGRPSRWPARATCWPGMLALDRRADRRWSPQGVRASAARHHPADVDDRLAPAARRSGVAFAIDRARRLNLPTRWSRRRRGGVLVRRRQRQPLHRTGRHQRGRCYTAYTGIGVPLLFVCEDNGWGISVPTPSRLDRALVRAPRRACATCRPTAATSPTLHDATSELVDWVRAAAPSGVAAPDAPCASWATPAPMSRPATGRRLRSVPTPPATRCSARHDCWSRPGAPRRRAARPLPASSAARCARWPSRCWACPRCSTPTR